MAFTMLPMIFKAILKTLCEFKTCVLGVNGTNYNI